MHAYIDPVTRTWARTDCPCVGPDAIALTDEEAALPWPHVLREADGTFRAMTEEERITVPLWRAIRAERNARIVACDWVVLRATERGEDVPEPWKVYRQALRDLPQTTTDPAAVVWPTAPEE